MEHVEWLLLIIIDWIQVVSIMNAIWDCKINITRRKMTIYMAVSVLVVILAVIFYQRDFYENTGLILCIFFAYLCVNKRKKMLWLGVILIYAVASCVDILVYGFVQQIELFQNTSPVAWGNSLGCVVVVAITQLYAKISHRKLDENANKAIILLSGCTLMIGSLVAAFPIIINEELLEGGFYIILFSLYVLMLMIGSILLVYFSIVNESYKLQELIGQEKQQLLNRYYNDVLKNNLQIRQFRHDYKNHIRSIKFFAKEQKYEQLLNYIEDMDEWKDYDSKCIDVGHEFVSAILSDYVAKCKEQGIGIEVSGIVMCQCGVADIDWSIILYNCINNAMEAVAKLDAGEKKIRIVFSEMKNKQLLTIENPILKIPVIKDGEIKTTKANSISHGLGMKNVKQSISKYRGSLSYKVNKDTMTIVTEVILRVNEMSKNDV